IVGDGDHAAPFGKARAEIVVLLEPFTQAVEPFGYRLAGKTRQGLGALVDLDARHCARPVDDLDERRTILRLLADRLVIEDDAGDAVPHGFVGPEQHLAIVAAGLRRGFDADRIEALLDRTAAFVRSQDALAVGRHPSRNVLEPFPHRPASCLSSGKPLADESTKRTARPASLID